MQKHTIYVRAIAKQSIAEHPWIPYFLNVPTDKVEHFISSTKKFVNIQYRCEPELDSLRRG